MALKRINKELQDSKIAQPDQWAMTYFNDKLQ